MPDYAVELLINEIDKIGEKIKYAKVGVLGVAYKGGISDIRESPAIKIISKLKNLGASVTVYDPHVPERSDVKNLGEFLQKCEYILLATNHLEFKSIENLDLQNVKVIIDGRNFLDKERIIKKGVIYKGIGR